MRPHTILHMVTTIDAKILGRRWPKVPGIKPGQNLFETTAATFNIPAWIVGTKTMSEFSSPPSTRLSRSARPIFRTDHLASPSAKSFAISVDNHASLRWKHNEVGGDHVVLVLPESVPNNYLAHLQDARVSYIFAGQKKVDLRTAMTKVRQLLHLKKLMIHGGGLFNAAMLRAGVVDEISHVILPIADVGGNGVPSIFDTDGRAPAKSLASLKLLSHKQLPGKIQWLRYRVTSYHASPV